MNKYCEYSITRFYNMFVNRSFDQNDVALFIIISRDYTKRGSIFRELGDFLAHPDEKDRGLVIKNISDHMPNFDSYLEADYQAGGRCPEKIPTFTGIGTHQEIIDNLNEIFGLVNLDLLNIDKNNQSFREFMFCLIFLLGNFKLKHNGKLLDLKVYYANALELQVKCSSKRYYNHYAILPIMTVINVWTGFLGNSNFDGHTLNGMVVRRFKEGALGAIAYERDNHQERPSFKNFKRGEVWPMDAK